jgi:THO complex subunit 2
LKLLSSLLDQVHETLIQYVGFLRANFDKTEFLDISPSLWDLCNQYQLDPEVAWFIIRAKLDILVENDKTAFGSESRVKTVVDAMDLDSKQQESRATVTAQIFEDFSNGAPVPDCVMQASQATNVWLHSLQPYIMDSYRILPKETWKHISPHFYVTFWQLNLHDIYVPSGESLIATLHRY